jgi:predicted RNA-binding protein YlxR (DUF448 family)
VVPDINAPETTDDDTPGESAPGEDAPVEETAGEDGSHRRCIASGEVRPTAEMVRYVVGPDNTVVPDVDGRLPGRGLWLSAQRDMVETAASKRLFAKAARGNVTVPANLADTVADLLRRRCLNHLGLARRAGLVVAGAEKVRASIAAGRTGALCEAADGSLQERRKITDLAPGVPVIDVFSMSELGGALGREAAVHVALAQGELTRRMLTEAARYRGMRRAPH